MSKLTLVRLLGEASIGGRARAAGDAVEVDAVTLRHLTERGHAETVTQAEITDPAGQTPAPEKPAAPPPAKKAAAAGKKPG